MNKVENCFRHLDRYKTYQVVYDTGIDSYDIKTMKKEDIIKLSKANHIECIINGNIIFRKEW